LSGLNQNRGSDRLSTCKATSVLNNNKKGIKMSNYDKIFKVLSEWYNAEQIDKIWEILKDFDNNNKTRRV
tara:strand:- start:221 stop:430 length:210 start_codon:yes stop_codon:yes gene_type:complete